MHCSLRSSLQLTHCGSLTSAGCAAWSGLKATMMDNWVEILKIMFWKHNILKKNKHWSLVY